MKASEAILKGFKKVNGNQCKDLNFLGGTPTYPKSVCVLGALSLGFCGNADGVFDGRGNSRARNVFIGEFQKAWGCLPWDLNDEGMPWEDLYGMAVAAGL